ncbi:D-alanyl-D-alanine carboxypeptidase [Paenibacillus motobuensis]|uniref:D-alanyl-D-alanine carboxypeptidase family protein n=1 Tax=Paenibacillus TaxID=44249 RepID=UPI00203F4FC4|nr:MULTISPECIES: D-alanyl-D-alanine carboxypeptidase family protein [Paenibacillus]MCM3040210.1 D-alanyl-D-alanine carboxypeptidase [Paenibacillus lutimineralis]MCM3647314.1 D-alanyl-D-alanine carboxypeptidase [Paenibacillus motobuensis]
MKKLLISGLMALILTVSAWPIAALAEDGGARDNAEVLTLAENARSAILIDADTGTVIYEKHSHEKLPPASITKIMTMLLTMEAIDEGRLKLTDKVTTSEHASSMGGSQIFLEVGEEMTVDDLLKGVAMASGNDASVALAEKIAGSEQGFIKLMNERAQELGLKDTHFANCNGLPVADHYSSAHDIAMMSRELLKYEGITKYTGSYQDYLRKDSAKPFWLVNTNKLVRFYSGADGLKTGYTSEAKFCLAATAKRDGMRLIAVVLGEPNTKTRNSEVSAMFDYAFSQYALQPIYKSGEVIGKVKVQKGEAAQLELTASKTMSVLVKKGSKLENITQKLVVPEKIAAPVKEGQLIGQLLIVQDGRTLAEFDLNAATAIKKAGFWTLFKRTASHMFFVD